MIAQVQDLWGDILITGGAGFIGSHLAEALLTRGLKVTILDNFSTGKPENLRSLRKGHTANIVREDLKDPQKLEDLVDSSQTIFHLAANPEVRIGEINPAIHFQENVLTTYNLLETLGKQEGKVIVFTSTSTVYGEAEIQPTPEDYGPLIPISTYGASKLACEALIMSYAHTFNHKALILRLANVIGPRSQHGVIHDFIEKTRKDTEQLEILGDGTQTKSYMHISDFIDATTHITNIFIEDSRKVDVYNVGSEDSISVKAIAKIVSKEIGRPNIKYKFTGGVNGGRGWKGDVKTMLLSIEKLRKTGWKPKYTSREAVKLATKASLQERRATSEQSKGEK